MPSPVRLRSTAARPRGFTLMEIVVAIFLLGIGLMGLAALTTTVTRANFRSSTLTDASALAQDKIKYLRIQPYGSLTAGSDVQTVNGVAYTRAWTVADTTPAAGLTEMVVTVSWTARGLARSATLSTIREKQ